MELSQFQSKLLRIGLITTSYWLWQIAVVSAEGNLGSVPALTTEKSPQLSSPVVPNSKTEITQQSTPAVVRTN